MITTNDKINLILRRYKALKFGRDIFIAYQKLFKNKL